MMEVMNVRCCDTATFVALINMLKEDLSSTPEIYNTLLAVLCDFDPYKHGNRERTVRYIRLLVKDKVLANCLLTSLPQASAELQNLPFYTGTLPDMKRALRQKFKGMKMSVPIPEVRSEEKRGVPADVVNQKITVIVTDQDQTNTSDLKDSNNNMIVQTEPDSCSHSHGSTIEKITSVITSSSQAKCVIKSPLRGPNSETPALLQLSMPVVKNVPKPVVINQPASTIHLNLPSQNKGQSTSTTNVSRNVPQSRLNDLVALVKSRSNSGCNVGQDFLSTSAENLGTNMIPKPTFYRGSDMNCLSTFVPREGQFSQNSTQNLSSISQARLPKPLVPILYQPYTYPIPGSTGYQSCFTGYTANPLIPWTPLTYFQGYTPYPHGPSLQLTRSSSTSGMDSTLDLSLEKKPSSQTQQKQNDTWRNISENDVRPTKKRSSSVSSVPNGNEIQDPKQKVRKMSTETPLYPGSSNMPYNLKRATKSVSDSTATYLHLTDDGESKDEKQNSLKALQELTLRINGNLGVKSTQGPNLSTSRKSLSTGDLTDTWRHFLLNPKKRVNESKSKGDLSVSSVQPSMAVFKQYDVPSSQNSSLSAHNAATAIRPPTEAAQTSNKKQYQHISCMPSLDNIQTPVTSYPQKLVHSLKDQAFVQLYGEPKVSHSAYYKGQESSLKNAKPIETESSIHVPLSDVNKKGPICMRSFPYSQHIQLPDGNVPVVEFPALTSQSLTNISKSSSFNNKTIAKDEKFFNFKPDIRTELPKTFLSGKKSNDTLTNETVKDGPNRYSLFMTKTDLPSKTEEPLLSKSQESQEEIDSSKSKETCLIIETTSENGTEQVQFKLDKQRSANLLGELLKFKPMSQTDQEKIDPDSRESSLIGSVSNKDVGKCNQQILELNSDANRKDDVNNTADNGQPVAGNVGSATKEKPDLYLGSETESSFSSLNVSPYLFNMLPDTTTLIDDDRNDDINDDEFTDCDEEDDDDVFLHPIF